MEGEEAAGCSPVEGDSAGGVALVAGCCVLLSGRGLEGSVAEGGRFQVMFCTLVALAPAVKGSEAEASRGLMRHELVMEITKSCVVHGGLGGSIA